MNEQLTIPILAAVAAVCAGAAILLGRWARRQPLRRRLDSLGDAGDASSLAPGADSPRISEVVGTIGTAIAPRGGTPTLQEHLTQAGYHDRGAAGVYVGAKMLLLLIGALAVGALVVPTQLQGTTKLLWISIVAGLLFFLPNVIVGMKRASRCAEVRRHLPDAIDLLEICTSAGMGLDMSWNSVTDEVRAVCPTLADEMALTNLEIHLGATRAEAMRHMARRTGAEELHSLVAVLVQSERFGTRISDALRTYATSMRETRSQMAQESAEKLGVKLIFPMVIFIFPAVVMVMAGPGFMMLYRAMKAS